MANEPSRENPNGPIGTEIIFENDQVRVWDMRVPARGKKAVAPSYDGLCHHQY